MSNVIKFGISLFCFLMFFPVIIFAGKIQSSDILTVDDCLISISHFNGEQNKKNRVIIDVRNSEDYDLFHINQTLNIKPHLISTKNYLKNKKIILLDNSYKYNSLLHLCKKLKTSGFSSVYVLDGGIQTLIKNNKLNIEGNDVIESLYYLTPQEMLEIAQQDKYLVVNITGKEDKRLNVYFSNIITTTENLQKKSHLKEVSQIIEKNKKTPAVLIVGQNNDQYSLVNKFHQTNQHQTFLYLKDGLTGLTRFEYNIKAILGKREFTLKNIKGCSN